MSDAESWTRRMLEAEARKRGIRDPEARSRLELARLILAHDYTSTRSTRRMLGKLVGDAAAKLTTLAVERTPGATPADERRRQTERSLERRRAAADAARAAPAAQSGTAAAGVEPARAIAPTPPAGTAQVGGAPALAAAAEPQPSLADSPARAPATTTATPPSAAPPYTAPFPTQPAAAAFPTPPLAAAPPSTASFPTQPTNAAFSTQPSAAGPTLPAAAAFPTQPSAASEDRLDHTRREARTLHLRWRVSEQGADRARILLGMRGELAVRIVSVRADEDHVVHSEVTEHGPIDSSGEWTAQLESADTHCVSAIGLRSAGRFVSIVHCSSRPDAAAAS
jgi:hypothetical protein